MSNDKKGRFKRTIDVFDHVRWDPDGEFNEVRDESKNAGLGADVNGREAIEDVGVEIGELRERAEA